MINKVGKKASIKSRPKGIQEIRKSIKAEWNRLAAYKKEAEERRNKFLEECLERSCIGDAKRRKAIHQIRQRERAKRRYRKIRGVLQRLKNGGLTHLDVPIYDQEDNIIGWESVTNKEEVHQALIDRNNKHLNQAQTTPFGHGEEYQLLHDEDKREETMQALLNGEIHWRHLCEMFNN